MNIALTLGGYLSRRSHTVFATALMAFCAACANAQVTIPGTTTPVPFPDLPTVASPEILVYFKLEGSGDKARYCPQGTAFRGKIKTASGTEVNVILPTAVPVSPSMETEDESKLKKIYWRAVNMAGEPIKPPQGSSNDQAEKFFKYHVYFTPFKGDILKSKYENRPKGGPGYYVGDKRFLQKNRLPEGASYKYTIATMRWNKEKEKFVLHRKCAPLDPLIRVSL